MASVKAERRDRLAILAQILEIAKEGTVKTQIMYKANLSFTQLNEYLSFMEKNNLIAIGNSDGKAVYAITLKGMDFLQRHNELAKMLNGKMKQASTKS